MKKIKKSILKNVLILSLALFGLGVIGNNNVMLAMDPPGDATIDCTCSIWFWNKRCSAAIGWNGTCHVANDNCWESNLNCRK